MCTTAVKANVAVKYKMERNVVMSAMMSSTRKVYCSLFVNNIIDIAPSEIRNIAGISYFGLNFSPSHFTLM